MKKIIKLTESDLVNIVKKVLTEQKLVNTASSVLGTAKSQLLNPKNLKFGDVGNDVRILQKKLMNLGYLKIKKTTGYFGNKTKSALANALSAKSQVTSSDTTKNVTKDTAKLNTKTQQSSYTYSPRIDAELNYIKERQGIWDKLTGGKPFFIYDPKFNLIYLFNGDFSLIKSSGVVDGKDAQKDTKPFTQEDWCKAAKLDITPYKCTNPKTKEKVTDPPYWVLNNLEVKFIPKGIYNISALGRHEGYEGKGTNVYHLKDSSGKSTTAALHGIPQEPGRLQASKDLASILQADKNNGKVPQQYLDSIDTVIASANLSYGCVGIPASFFEDQKVISVVEEGIPVYVMGEGDKGYLVQNSGDYFDKLGGLKGMCVNPESTAKSMGTSISGPSKPDYSNIA